MKNKHKEYLTAFSASLSGSLPFSEEDCKRFHPFVYLAMVTGYQIGKGVPVKSITDKAIEMFNEEFKNELDLENDE